MKNSTKTIIFIIVAALIVFVVISAANLKISSTGNNGGQTATSTNTGGNTPAKPVSSVAYSCNAGKTINATFYTGTSVPASGNNPPQPGGSAHVVLSDGRAMDLKQTLSADGARYSNGNPQVSGNETFVFWSKGNGALVLENNQQKNYIGCVAVAAASQDLPNVYSNGTDGFSIRYPQGFTVDANYSDQVTPSKTFSGVKFTIPASMAKGTNLSNDSYVAVELIPKSNGTCNAGMFFDPAMKVAYQNVTDAGKTYSYASSTDAAAGNRYEEDIYALPGTNPCIAVHYLIHWGVYENYPAGSIKEFDKDALTKLFDEMRQSLVINQ